jgi:hypothetical protein
VEKKKDLFCHLLPTGSGQLLHLPLEDVTKTYHSKVQVVKTQNSLPVFKESVFSPNFSMRHSRLKTEVDMAKTCKPLSEGLKMRELP